MNLFIIAFGQINLTHLPQVGGKHAPLGEMFNKLLPLGIEVPDGSAVMVERYINLPLEL